jgi:hypothetical protein
MELDKRYITQTEIRDVVNEIDSLYQPSGTVLGLSEKVIERLKPKYAGVGESEFEGMVNYVIELIRVFINPDVEADLNDNIYNLMINNSDKRELSFRTIEPQMYTNSIYRNFYYENLVRLLNVVNDIVIDILKGSWHRTPFYLRLLDSYQMRMTYIEHGLVQYQRHFTITTDEKNRIIKNREG